MSVSSFWLPAEPAATLVQRLVAFDGEVTFTARIPNEPVDSIFFHMKTGFLENDGKTSFELGAFTLNSKTMLDKVKLQ